jgi:hypothetical protein
MSGLTLIYFGIRVSSIQKTKPPAKARGVDTGAEILVLRY